MRINLPNIGAERLTEWTHCGDTNMNYEPPGKTLLVLSERPQETIILHTVQVATRHDQCSGLYRNSLTRRRNRIR